MPARLVFAQRMRAGAIRGALFRQRFESLPKSGAGGSGGGRLRAAAREGTRAPVAAGAGPAPLRYWVRRGLTGRRRLDPPRSIQVTAQTRGDDARLNLLAAGDCRWELSLPLLSPGLSLRRTALLGPAGVAD